MVGLYGQIRPLAREITFNRTFAGCTFHDTDLCPGLFRVVSSGKANDIFRSALFPSWRGREGEQIVGLLLRKRGVAQRSEENEYEVSHKDLDSELICIGVQSCPPATALP